MITVLCIVIIAVVCYYAGFQDGKDVGYNKGWWDRDERSVHTKSS